MLQTPLSTSLSRFALLALLSAASGCGRVGIDLTEPEPPEGLDAGQVIDAAPLVDVSVLDAGFSELDAQLDTGADAADCLDDDDRDGVCAELDNCPDLANREQADADRDQRGDACDPCPGDAMNDSDGDGVCAPLDGCPSDSAKTAPGVCGCNSTKPTGLVGHWRFDESTGLVAADDVASHPGALQNFALSGWVSGQAGNALSFDGSDDSVAIGAVSPTIRALSFWLRPSAFALETVATPWRSPTANGDPNTGWLDPTNAYRSDNEYTNGGLVNGVLHDWSGFGLELAATATITGIEAQVELNTSNPTGTFGIELSWNRGVTYTSTGNAAALLVADRYWTFGAAMDGWGHAWSPAQLLDTAFRVRLSKEGINFSPMTPGVDHIQVRVHHAPLAMNRMVLSLRDGVRVELTQTGLVAAGFPSGTQVYVDGALGAALDTSFHHVVIALPTAIAATQVQVGGQPGYAYPLQGTVDDLRMFSEPLRTEDIALLHSRPLCR